MKNYIKSQNQKTRTEMSYENVIFFFTKLKNLQQCLVAHHTAP